MGGFFCKQTLRDINAWDRTVLVRADYNVPLDIQGQVSNDLRLRASLPTLQYLLERRCRVVVMSHLGRPQGRQARYSLAVVAQRLADLLGQPVQFVDDCVGDRVRQAVRRLAPGQLLLLENLRFYAEEEANDTSFAQAIVRAVRPDYLVQDGFGVVHRAHASTQAISLYVPSVAGLLVEKEMTTILGALQQPPRPLVALLGGVKVSDKLAVIEQLIARADTLLIGGAMANTFLAYRGHHMGASQVEIDQAATLQRLYQLAEQKVGAERVDEFLCLPVDVAVGQLDQPDAPRREVPISAVAADEAVLDIGTQTIQQFCSSIRQARTVIWNGPLGYTPVPVWRRGSAEVARAIGQTPGLQSIIGGGDTAEFLLSWDPQAEQNFTHISTGGGASLELIAGQPLPGIESLLDAYGLGCYTKHKEYHDAEVDHR